MFIQEIESMDADTTSTVDDEMVNRQLEEAVSSTTEDERPAMSAAEGSDAWQDPDYNGKEGTVLGKSCVASVSLTCKLFKIRIYNKILDRDWFPGHLFFT